MPRQMSCYSEEMLTPVDARRRWFGSFFLILAGGLMIWGFTFMHGLLIKNPLWFLAYWLSVFVLTVVSFGIAVYDMMVVRRRLREEQRSAFNRAFGEVIHDVEKLEQPRAGVSDGRQPRA